MINGESKGLRLINWPSLLTFVLLSWGILLVPPRLRSLRPSVETSRTTMEARGNLYETRLWQDPFDILPEARKGQQALPRLADSITSTVDPGSKSLILVVLVSGGEYPEDVETRLRSRYAVVSALGVSGYVPDQGGSLRCGTSPWRTAVEPFPHETYSLAATPSATNLGQVDLGGLTRITDPSTSPRRIVVVWFDERLCNDPQPASRLQAWVASLVGATRAMAIVGPQESGTLLGLLREPVAALAQDPPPARVKIYSFCSTVASLRPPAVLPPGHAAPTASLESHGFDLVHVIGTDGELAIAIRDELALRGVNQQKRIALVSEWDTFYSESMLDVFNKALPSRPRVFTYQRGIDGRLPRESASPASSTGGGVGPLSFGMPITRGPSVSSFGRSQVDYLPRLVEQMKAIHGQDWAAIGVLGSDFYDKLLILEALKHEFPGALCFTTDLDERYLDSSAQPTTRNLLIASHYGLALHEGLQRGIPPFRGVYQTSLFLGCLRALRENGVPAPQPPTRLPVSRLGRLLGEQDSPEPPTDPGQIAWTPDAGAKGTVRPRPLVFEISQSQAYPLTDPGADGVHPRSLARSGIIDVRAALVLCVLLPILGGWLLTGWTSLRALVTTHTRLTGIVLISTLILLTIMLFDHQRANGEPFAMLEGISTWPSTLVRLGVALFCLIALTRAHETDFANARSLNVRFGLPVMAEWNARNSIACLAFEGKTCDPRPVWARYRWLSLPRQRTVRVLLMTLLYMGISGLLLIRLELPRDPYRGELNLVTNRVVLAIAVALAVSLLWAVIDANRLCNRMIHVFDDNPIEWPERAQLEMAVRAGVEPRHCQQWDRPELAKVLSTSLNRMASVAVMAERSTVIEPMMFSAAVAYLFLFLARSPFFDQYVMSPILVLVFSVALLGVFCCGAWLRRSMGWAQRNAIHRVRKDLLALRLRLASGPANEAVEKGAESLEKIAQGIAAIKTGALSPLAENPVLHTSLLLVGGIGALLSMEPIRALLF